MIHTISILHDEVHIAGEAYRKRPHRLDTCHVMHHRLCCCLHSCEPTASMIRIPSKQMRHPSQMRLTSISRREQICVSTRQASQIGWMKPAHLFKALEITDSSTLHNHQLCMPLQTHSHAEINSRTVQIFFLDVILSLSIGLLCQSPTSCRN